MTQNLNKCCDSQDSKLQSPFPKVLNARVSFALAAFPVMVSRGLSHHDHRDSG